MTKGQTNKNKRRTKKANIHHHLFALRYMTHKDILIVGGFIALHACVCGYLL